MRPATWAAPSPSETSYPSTSGPARVTGTDQRGKSRKTVARLACDVGAYDTGGVALEVLYVKATASSDPPCSSASATHPFATIAAALACASDGTTIKLGGGTFSG